MNRKTENHHRLEGTLAATVKHLEDLRVIVFSEQKAPPVEYGIKQGISNKRKG